MTSRSNLRISALASWVVPGVAAMALGGVVQAQTTFVHWGRPDYLGTPPAGLTNIRAMFSGYDSAGVLRFDGTLVVWGPGRSRVFPPLTASGVVDADMHAASVITLSQNGAVAVFGSVTQAGGPPAQPPSDLGPCVAVRAGFPYHGAIRDTGQLVVWPSGMENLPTQIFNVSNFALGYGNIVILRNDGSLLVGDSGGQPELRAIPPGVYSSPITDVDIYGLHAAALRQDGSVICWGNNSWGQSNVPPLLGPCKDVATGYYHTIALRTDGSVIGWGRNLSGEASPPPGFGEPLDRIAAGDENSMALGGDCDQNNVSDLDEIAAAPWLDCNNNFYLDVCQDTATPNVPIKWTAVTGGNFQDPSSWCFTAPTTSSSISFPYSPTYNVFFSQNRTLRSASVGGGFPSFRLAGKTLTLANTQQPSQAMLQIGTVAGTPASLGLLGGTVSASFTEVGYAAGSEGTLFVGPGGISASTQEICVGCAGEGGMNVVNGGRVVSQKGVIGRTPAGPGVVLVEGNPGNPQQGVPPIESSWDSTLGIDVRNGTLTVGQHGVINSPAVGVVLFSGGVLEGTGRINGTVTNFGAAAGSCGAAGLLGGEFMHQRGGLLPGGSIGEGESLQGGPTIGTLTINGVYQQIASNPLLGTNSGSLLIEVFPGANGPEHDRLVVNGTASFGGGLFVEFPGGDPGDLNALPIVTATNVDPNRPMFDVAVMPGLPDGRFVKVDSVETLQGGGGITISTSSLSALLGFGGASTSGVPLEPRAATIADFDGKNGPDLAVTTAGPTPSSNGSLFVLLNDGNGGLQQAQQFPGGLGVEPVGIVAARLNPNSTAVDLAVVNRVSDSMQVLYNHGDGSFAAPLEVDLDVGSGPTAIAAAPIYAGEAFAGGVDDLVVTYGGSNQVAVFKVTGTLPWGIPLKLPVPVQPTDVDGVDIDNNRTFDLVVTSRGSSTLTVLAFNGKTQQFDDGIDFLTGEDPVSLETADFDGDGLLDVVTVNRESNSASVLLNRTAPGGSTSFAPAVSLPTGDAPESVVAGDFDLDLDLDIAFTARSAAPGTPERVVKILRNDRQNGVLVFAPADDQVVPGAPKIVLAAEMDPTPGIDLVTVALGGESPTSLGGLVGNASVRPALGGKKPCIAGDVDCDGVVDANDLGALLGAWGSANPAADFNGDGVVGADDLAVLLANWGAGQS